MKHHLIVTRLALVKATSGCGVIRVGPAPQISYLEDSGDSEALVSLDTPSLDIQKSLHDTDLVPGGNSLFVALFPVSSFPGPSFAVVAFRYLFGALVPYLFSFVEIVRTRL